MVLSLENIAKKVLFFIIIYKTLYKSLLRLSRNEKESHRLGAIIFPYFFLDRAQSIRYTIKVLFAARWCSGLTCRPVTAEIVSSNLIRVAIAEVAQW